MARQLYRSKVLVLMIGTNILILHNVRYIPDLSESIYSLFLHIQSPCHKLKSTFDDGLYIIFPDFKTKAIIGSHDIYLDATPVDCVSFQDTTNILPLPDSSLLCRPFTNFQSDVTSEIHHLDNILRDLRQYYATVKTKRQLGLDVPAGFRKSLKHTKLFYDYVPTRELSTSSSLCENVKDSSLATFDTTLQNSKVNHTVSLDITEFQPQLSTNPSSNSPVIPIIRSVDKPSTLLPKTIKMSEDYLCACVGFCRVDTLERHFDHLYQPTIVLDNTPANAILDNGHFATLKKRIATQLQYFVQIITVM
jgi:hypothetical protein